MCQSSSPASTEFCAGLDCLHYLRRIAAHLWAGNGLPVPCLDGKAAQDPVLRGYYQTLCETPNLPFAHLLNHADDCGYYLPVPFSTPLEPGFAVIENEGCQVSGSSYTLLEECTYLADFLELPLELDPETVREASLSQEKGEAVWERYGVESFVCAALHTSCEIADKAIEWMEKVRDALAELLGQ